MGAARRRFFSTEYQYAKAPKNERVSMRLAISPTQMFPTLYGPRLQRHPGGGHANDFQTSLIKISD
jgi:hypothetical protein